MAALAGTSASWIGAQGAFSAIAAMLGAWFGLRSDGRHRGADAHSEPASASVRLSKTGVPFPDGTGGSGGFGSGSRALVTRLLGGRLEELARSHGRIALMVIDVDRMRDLNVVYGYRLGDAVLDLLERRLAELAGNRGHVERLAGDRFVVLLPRGDGADGGEQLFRKLRLPLRLGGLEVTVNLSGGSARFPEDATCSERLLRAGELALDRAKASGGGRLIPYEPSMDQVFRRRKSLESEIRRGLERGEFALFYQPQLDLTTGRVTGVEALLRWPHRPGGPLSPAQFIPVAETSGLIRALGAWVMREACAAARRWHDRGFGVTMCINLSVAQLRHQDVTELVRRTLSRYRLPLHALELELTESLFVDPAQIAIRRNIMRLRNLGVRLAIDDFGTGYSSLAYLKRLPAERIKVDKAFVRGLGGDPADEALMRTIIALGRLFGKRVLAEGVEEEAQRVFLQREGCDEAQGYLFAKPLSETECLDFLRNANAAHPAVHGQGQSNVVAFARS